jgi:transcriptional regulator with XRE-family HTH domain
LKPLNELFRDMREDKDISQHVIAEVIGISQQQYSKYEKGKRDLPLQALPILADYYDVSADFLIGRKGEYFNIPNLEMSVTKTKTVTEVITDLLALDSEGRAAVVDFIFLQHLKEEHFRRKEDK